MKGAVAITATTNAPEWNKKFSEWWQVSKKSLPVALSEEGVGIARWLATPNSSVKPATPPSTVGEGKRAVERDILSLIGPITQQSVPRIFSRTVFLQRQCRTLLIKRDVMGMEKLLNRTYPGLTLLRPNEFRSAHSRRRDSRGRIRVTRRPYATMHVRELREYIKERQEGVGMARGGWAPYLLSKGKSVPSWISRHSNQGTFADRTGDPVLPSLTLRNRSPWAWYREETTRIMDNALAGRTVALATKIGKIFEREAKR